MKKTVTISGMKCQGCVNTVTERLSSVVGVKSVSVDLEKSEATIEGFAPTLLLKAALKGTKFQLHKS